jgi:hypothetical protein
MRRAPEGRAAVRSARHWEDAVRQGRRQQDGRLLHPGHRIRARTEVSFLLLQYISLFVCLFLMAVGGSGFLPKHMQSLVTKLLL